MFLYVKVISSFKSLRVGSHVFALLMLFRCVICGRVRACGTLVGVLVFSVMWSELLMPSAFSCPLWSSGIECQRVKLYVHISGEYLVWYLCDVCSGVRPCPLFCNAWICCL